MNLILISVVSLKLLNFCKEWLKTPALVHLTLPSPSISQISLIKDREEKLKLEVSIPMKLSDGWDPMVKIKLNNFSCFDLCDVGASASVLPKRIYDMLELKPFDLVLLVSVLLILP